MGTNYYACRKLNKSNKENVIRLLDEDKYEELVEYVNENSSKIHIGKQSCGWQFLFNYNHFKYYDLNRKSINEFLLKYDIIDEYGNKINIEDFWYMVDSNAKMVNNKKYYASEPMLPFMILEEIVPLDLKEYKVELREFYSDGLRFSSSTEFC